MFRMSDATLTLLLFGGLSAADTAVLASEGSVQVGVTGHILRRIKSNAKVSHALEASTSEFMSYKPIKDSFVGLENSNTKNSKLDASSGDFTTLPPADDAHEVYGQARGAAIEMFLADASTKCFVDRVTFFAVVLSFGLAAIWFGILHWVQKNPEEGGSDDASEAAAARVPLIDNAKFCFVCMVIFVHLDHPQAPALFDGLNGPIAQTFLNPWCTRACCFLSGLVARGRPSWSGVRSLLVRVVLPIVFYTTLLRPVGEYMVSGWPKTFAQHTRLASHYLFPHFTHAGGDEHLNLVWYLFALVGWRLWGLLLAPLPQIPKMVAALLIGVAGGYATVTLFALSWSMVMFPLYVAGQIFPLEVMNYWRWRNWRPATCAIGVGLLAGLLALTSEFSVKTFLNDIPGWGWSEELSIGYGWPDARPPCSSVEAFFFPFRGLFRNLMELTKTLIFLILCCPRSEGIMSNLGRNSIYPFLLHLLVLHMVKHWMGHAYSLILQYWMGSIAVAILMNVLLSSNPVRAVFRVFLDPAWIEQLWQLRGAKKDVRSLGSTVGA